MFGRLQSGRGDVLFRGMASADEATRGIDGLRFHLATKFIEEKVKAVLYENRQRFGAGTVTKTLPRGTRAQRAFAPPQAAIGVAARKAYFRKWPSDEVSYFGLFSPSFATVFGCQTGRFGVLAELIEICC